MLVCTVSNHFVSATAYCFHPRHNANKTQTCSIIHITLFVRKCIEYNARKKQVLVDTLVQELSRRNQETQEQTVHTVSPISPASYKEYPRKAEEMPANWDKPVELSAMNTNVYEMDASPPCPKELA